MYASTGVSDPHHILGRGVGGCLLRFWALPLQARIASRRPRDCSSYACHVRLQAPLIRHMGGAALEPVPSHAPLCGTHKGLGLRPFARARDCAFFISAAILSDPSRPRRSCCSQSRGGLLSRGPRRTSKSDWRNSRRSRRSRTSEMAFSRRNTRSVMSFNSGIAPTTFPATCSSLPTLFSRVF